MRIIPKTLKTKEVVKNHITMNAFIFIAFSLMSIAILSLYVVHSFFKIPFFIISAIILWLSTYPSKWNKDITRIELYIKFLLAYRGNSYERTKEEIFYGIEHYENEKEESELDKARKKAGKRTF